MADVCTLSAVKQMNVCRKYKKRQHQTCSLQNQCSEIPYFMFIHPSNVAQYYNDSKKLFKTCMLFYVYEYAKEFLVAHRQ